MISVNLFMGDFNSRIVTHLDLNDTSNNLNVDLFSNLNKFDMSRNRNSLDKIKKSYGNLLL